MSTLNVYSNNIQLFKDSLWNKFAKIYTFLSALVITIVIISICVLFTCIYKHYKYLCIRVNERRSTVPELTHHFSVRESSLDAIFASR